MNLFELLDRRISHHSNLTLLVGIFIFIFVIPFFPEDSHQIIGNVFFSLIFFISIFTLNTYRKTMFTIAVIAFVTEWITEWINMPVLNYTNYTIK